MNDKAKLQYSAYVIVWRLAGWSGMQCQWWKKCMMVVMGPNQMQYYYVHTYKLNHLETLQSWAWLHVRSISPQDLYKISHCKYAQSILWINRLKYRPKRTSLAPLLLPQLRVSRTSFVTSWLRFCLVIHVRVCTVRGRLCKLQQRGSIHRLPIPVGKPLAESNSKASRTN